MTYQQQAPMLFSSGLFFFLFIGFLSIYRALRKQLLARIVYVTLFSLYFYYKSSGLFFLLLLFVATSDFCKRGLYHHHHTVLDIPGATDKLCRSCVYHVRIPQHFDYGGISRYILKHQSYVRGS